MAALAPSRRVTAIARVGFLFPDRGPLTPAHWSGTPLSLVTAMRGHGTEVVPIGYDAPRGLSVPVHALASALTPDLAAADHHPLKMRAREAAMRAALRRLPAVDAVVAVGTDSYRLDRLGLTVPSATYDDATLATMWSHPDSDTRAAGFDQARVRRWIAVQRASARAATLACVSTAWAARSFQRDYGLDPDRIRVVGMGHRPRGAARRERSDSPSYLFVGVDWQRKNGAAVLRAFARVREQHPDATLHLVGAHERVSAPGVIDHGLLRRDDPDAQRELDGLYATCTAFVLPSLFDPSPIAYLEAASAGLPVVATSQGGAGELLRDGALTVAPSSVEEITRAMLTLADPAEARRRGAAAARAASEATWHHVAGRILDALAAASA